MIVGVRERREQEGKNKSKKERLRKDPIMP
jgi:hypothetical protein